MGTAARAKSVARPPTNREAQPASPIEACLRESLHDSYGLVTSTTIAAITQQATLFLHISRLLSADRNTPKRRLCSLRPFVWPRVDPYHVIGAASVATDNQSRCLRATRRSFSRYARPAARAGAALGCCDAERASFDRSSSLEIAVWARRV